MDKTRPPLQVSQPGTTRITRPVLLSTLPVSIVLQMHPTDANPSLANITGIGWEEALEKAKDWVAQLTTEEKSALVTGTEGPCVGNIAPIPRLGFNGLCLQDGPLAIRQAVYANVYPAGEQRTFLGRRDCRACLKMHDPDSHHRSDCWCFLGQEARVRESCAHRRRVQREGISGYSRTCRWSSWTKWSWR